MEPQKNNCFIMFIQRELNRVKMRVELCNVKKWKVII